MLHKYSCFYWLLQWSNTLHSTSLLLLGYSFHNAYQCQGQTHQWYWLQLPYNSFRTCLTNHVWSISCHIMPLVINGLGHGQTHTQTHVQTRTHTHIHTYTYRHLIETILRNQAHASHTPVCTWFEIIQFSSQNGHKLVIKFCLTTPNFAPMSLYV